MKRKLIFPILLLLLLLCACAIAEVKPHEFAVANTNAVNVRKKPGGDLLQRLDKGESVFVLETTQKNGKTFAHVCLVDEKWTHQGWTKAGWVDTRYLTGVHDYFQNIVKLAVGHQHVVGLTADGRVLSMGATFMHPESFDGLTGVADIAAARYMTIVAMQDGSLRQTTDVYSPKPVRWESVVRLFSNSRDTDSFTGMRADGSLLTTAFWNTWEDVLTFPEDWRNVSQFFFCSSYAAALLENGTLKIMPRTNVDCPQSILSLSDISDVSDFAAGSNWMLLLMQDGSLRFICEPGERHNLSVSAAEDWSDIAHLYSGASYILGITTDGHVRMAGVMVSSDLNASHISNEQWVNLEDTGELNAFNDIVSAACSPQMIALLHADGTVDLLNGIRWNP